MTQVDQNAHLLHIKRSEYIRNALDSMNKQVLRNQRYSRLQHLSKLVSNESAKINSEFEAIAYESEA